MRYYVIASEGEDEARVLTHAFSKAEAELLAAVLRRGLDGGEDVFVSDLDEVARFARLRRAVGSYEASGPSPADAAEVALVREMLGALEDAGSGIRQAAVRVLRTSGPEDGRELYDAIAGMVGAFDELGFERMLEAYEANNGAFIAELRRREAG